MDWFIAGAGFVLHQIGRCKLFHVFINTGTNYANLLHGFLGGDSWFVSGRSGAFGVVVALLVCIAGEGAAQQISPLLHAREAPYGRGIEFGVDKITNTFVWVGNADVGVQTELGFLRFVNTYRSSAFRTSTLATRDDQVWQGSWLHPIGQQLHAIVRQGWIVSRDSRSIGLNQLERFNVAGGLQYTPREEISVELLAGVERSSQLGVTATGPLAGIVGRVKQLDVDQWQITADGIADWQRLDAQRRNSDVEVRTSIERTLAEGSMLRLSVESIHLGREFFTTLTQQSVLDVEQRSERRLGASADVTYAATDELSVNVRSTISSGAVDRSYASPVASLPLSYVERQLRELIVDVEGYVSVATDRLSITGGGSLYQRSERNGVRDVHGAADADIQSVRLQELQRDNQTLRTRLYGSATWLLSPHDTLRADASGWLVRYDTPSATNDDDRDELAAVATLSYGTRLSTALRMNVSLSGQYLHLVFLKASRSALNNVNRVLRLSPSFVYESPDVRLQPQFEILANYTVYDYEGSASSVRSFSFRQLSYRDSIRIRMSPTLAVEAPLLLRYFERSTFVWSNFAERPETGNLEYLAKVLIFSAPSDEWSVGAGLRLYTLEQQSLLPGGLNGSTRSIGPEMAFRYTALGGSTLTLSGWYEFQTINVTQRRELPNLLLRTVVRL